MTTTDRITVQPLTPERCDDYFTFFEGPAFSDNPDWSTCYCFFSQALHHCEKWSERTGAENRASTLEAITNGTMRGWLAYNGEEVIGWCNANRHERYTTLEGYGEAAPETGAITCFLVAPEHRGRGVARMLLDAAVEGFRSEGLQAVEGYPRIVAEGAGMNYHGPMALYLEAGFTPVREIEKSAVVRRELR